MAILIVLVGVITITRMSTDIFPNINIPVVSVIWSYPGVAPEEMEKRFVTVCERAMTTTVNDIEHIESQSYNGVAVIKVFFYDMAVIFAMLASYLLSRTVIPTMVKFLLRGHLEEIDTSLGRSLNSSQSALGPRAESGGLPDSSRGEEDFAARGRKRHARPVRFPAGFLRTFLAFFSSVHDGFNRVFEKIRDRYVEALRWCLDHSPRTTQTRQEGRPIGFGPLSATA
jgi:multidrug efflux pump subunit AcrB